jgi:amino-acid N-acetyltransferase
MARRNDVQVTAAAGNDFANIERLLGSLGLPTAGLSDQFPDAYAVVVRDGAVVGCAGLESYGRVGLLRSVAVASPARNKGIGRALVERQLEAARALGLEAVYLLTTTARDYFSRLGFKDANREAAPPALSACPEFASACPASASCLVLSF